MIPCSWKTDESPPCEQLNISDQPQADGYTKIQVISKGGSPLNIMARTSSSSSSLSGTEGTTFPDSYFFATRIIDSKAGYVSVGVVTPNEFLPGYKIKGMFYNGNLTNGSAALQCSYGPYLKSGDWVVLECTHYLSTNDDDNNNNNNSTGSTSFAMTIYVNGNKVGRGFEISITNPSDQRFYPCLSVSNKVELLVQVMDQKPDFSNVPQASVLPLQGKWKIVDAKKDTAGIKCVIPVKDEAGNLLTPQRDIIMTISQSRDGVLEVGVKVYNSLSMLVGYTSNHDKTVYELAPQKGIRTSLMMPPPPYLVVENELVHAMENHWQSFRLVKMNEGSADTANEFTINTVNNHVMARCVRLAMDNRPPLTKYYH
jgi:hypothetical protein